MASWWLDPWAGSANNSGDSGTVSLSRSDGVTYGTGDDRITSATGGFTGMAGRYIRINGSTTRLIVSVTSDTEVVVDDGFTAGSGRTLVIGGPNTAMTAFTTYLAAGDIVKMPKTDNCDAVSAGTLTWAVNDATLTFSSGRVKVIDQCESGWVGATNVTVAHATNGACDGNAVGLTIGSSFVSGLVAYKDLGSTIDFSSYGGISLMLGVRGSTALDYSKTWRIVGCSDAAGATPVDDLTLDIPCNIYGGHYPVTAYKGSALGSYRSIALYVTSDPGAPVVDLDNIVAVKAISDSDHLCHRCVLSQDDDFIGLEDWWGIRAFTADTTLELSGEFWGNSDGAISSYRRETVLRQNNMVSSLGAEPGTLLNPVEISGGWNTSDGTQDGLSIYTLVRNVLSSGTLFTVANNYDNFKFKNFMLALTNPTYGFVSFSGQSTGITFEDICCVGLMASDVPTYLNLAYGGSSALDAFSQFTFRGIRYTGIDAYALNCTPDTTGTYLLTANDWVLDDFRVMSCRALVLGGIRRLRGKDVVVNNCSSASGDPRGFTIYEPCSDWEINGLEMKDNATYGMTVRVTCNDIRLLNVVTSGNTSGAFLVNHGEIKLFNPSIAETTEFGTIKSGGSVHSIKHDQTADNHLITTYVGTIEDEASVRHTASGIAWKLSPTLAAIWPMRMKVATLAVASGVEYTVGLYMRRTNTGISGRFYTPGGQVGGIDDEISDSITANADIWELLSLTVESTENGVVDFWVEVQGGTTYSVYIDDFSIAEP